MTALPFLPLDYQIVFPYNGTDYLYQLRSYMSHVKAGGSSKNIHNNAGARLGVKRFGGQKVNEGEVLVRQTGATKVAGNGAYMSRNFTIHAKQDQSGPFPWWKPPPASS